MIHGITSLPQGRIVYVCNTDACRRNAPIMTGSLLRKKSNLIPQKEIPVGTRPMTTKSNSTGNTQQ